MLTQESDGQVGMKQMSMKKGPKIFGKDGDVAAKCKMQQLHDRNVMVPVKYKELAYDQKKEAIGYLTFLKCKRCSKIKGRGWADG